MPYYLADKTDLAALPNKTTYRLIADRPDLFGGKMVIEATGLLLPAAPATYPNGVPIAKGSGGEWVKTIARPVDPIPAISDADVITAVKARGLDTSLANSTAVGE